MEENKKLEVVVVSQTYQTIQGEVKESKYLAVVINDKYIRIKPVYESQTIELVLNARKVEIDLC